MDTLKEKLAEIKKSSRLGLMTHVVVGYPSLEKTIELVKLMAKEGVDIVELQIPFSDPLADGPTIMRACETSLRNGTKVRDAFTIMKQLSSQISIPLLFMVYYNTVFRYTSMSSRAKRGDLTGIASSQTPRNDNMSGVEKFCQDAKKAGASGLIVPDVSLEEESEEHFIALCKKYDLANIRVVSPSSTPERLEKNAKVASGFVYATARQGITGARDTLRQELSKYLDRVRKHFAIPVAVGFGISKREHIEALKGHADIAVVGSAIIDVINRSAPDAIEQNVRSFLKTLKVIN